ncbi:sialate O-acetylesterase [Puniceicoccaceae bacterium K14]|nr:sialate O-acetylesterase [Puniceicoccaceae bacterium K14]
MNCVDRVKLYFVIFWVFSSGSAWALELEMPEVFADQMVLQRDQEVPIWGVATAGAAIEVAFAGQVKRVLAGDTGKWIVRLGKMEASAKSRTLAIVARLGEELIDRTISDVLVGEVWFAGGQSNMYRPFRMLVGEAVDPKFEPIAEYLRTEAARANDPLLRQFRVGRSFNVYEKETKGRGNWSKAISGEVNEICGTAYFFARELRRELGVPVGLISCNLGATRIEPWIRPAEFLSHDVLAEEYARELLEHEKRLEEWDEERAMAEFRKALEEWEDGKTVGRKPRKPEHPSRNKQMYGTLFNGMVSPLIPYAMKGIIWYQGESNTGNYPEQYDLRLSKLIEGWRSAWGQESLFVYWCQLANYRDAKDHPVGDEDTWALLQDRQRQALRIPDTGMAVLNDIGEARDIHPKNKVDAGKRLSLWALSQAYGKGGVCSGPLFREAKRVGERVLIAFDSVGSGLMIGHKHLMEPTIEVDETLNQFQISGVDGEWKWAEARIVANDQVEVWHADIEEPIEVRYAWSSNPEGANLYNREGLPTSIFGTGKL